MALSFETKTADGTTKTFTFSFGYLSTDDLHVYVNGVEDTTKTFPTASSYELTNMPEAGDKVTIQRTTDRSKLTVTIPNSGTFRGKDINAQSLQALYIAQEAYDALTGVIGQDVFDTTASDGQNRRIKNVADPIDDQDVATKKWSETSMTSQLSQAIAAKNAAATSETNAAASASTSASKASTATTQAGIATTQAGISTTKAAAAAASAQAAADDRAAVAADKATVASDMATVAADKGTVENLLDGFVGQMQTASVVPVTPAGNISSNNVQDALQELDAEKLNRTGDTVTGSWGISGFAGAYRSLVLLTGTLYRWILSATGEAETGSNAGSNLAINSYNDAGAYLDTPLVVNRASGVFNFKYAPTVSGNKVYHAGNDGHGSGLDADTVDGIQGSDIVQNSTLQSRIAAAAIGDLGTYGFFYFNAATVVGGVLPASNLAWADISGGTNTAFLTGSWMCVGTGGPAGNRTVFKRVA